MANTPLEPTNDQDNTPKSSEDLAPKGTEKQKPPADQSLSLKVDQLNEELAAVNKKTLYLKAELQNTLHKHSIDLKNARNSAVTRFALAVLPVMESLEHAVLADNSQETSNLKKGVENTLKMFQDALAQNNIKAIDPMNEAFDPHFHEAMSTGNQTELPDNQIIGVMQKGFMMGQHVLRHARVVINKPIPKEED